MLSAESLVEVVLGLCKNNRLSSRIKEAFRQVAQDVAKKLSIVQEIMIRSTDDQRRIVAPAGSTRRRYDVLLVPAFLTASRWKTTFCGSLGEKGVTIGGARSVEKSTTGATKQALGVANR